MPRYIARVSILERHADGTARQFDKTKVVEATDTVKDLFEWRNKKVHDPLNGEFAASEIILTPDDVD
jgi:hypothetical protein